MGAEVRETFCRFFPTSIPVDLPDSAAAGVVTQEGPFLTLDLQTHNSESIVSSNTLALAYIKYDIL